jgi:hypothetical protein
MSDDPDYWDALGPDTPADVLPVAERLRRSRPFANPSFRGALERSLDRTVERLDPARERGLIVLYGTCGAALLLAGVLSAAGVGPLG